MRRNLLAARFGSPEPYTKQEEKFYTDLYKTLPNKEEVRLWARVFDKDTNGDYFEVINVPEEIWVDNPVVRQELHRLLNYHDESDDGLYGYGGLWEAGWLKAMQDHVLDTVIWVAVSHNVGGDLVSNRLLGHGHDKFFFYLDKILQSDIGHFTLHALKVTASEVKDPDFLKNYIKIVHKHTGEVPILSNTLGKDLFLELTQFRLDLLKTTNSNAGWLESEWKLVTSADPETLYEALTSEERWTLTEYMRFNPKLLKTVPLLIEAGDIKRLGDIAREFSWVKVLEEAANSNLPVPTLASSLVKAELKGVPARTLRKLPAACALNSSGKSLHPLAALMEEENLTEAEIHTLLAVLESEAAKSITLQEALDMVASA